jgi:hypothetical protein
MGEFARQVKNEKIPGPYRRTFKREDWEAIARREDTDLDDKRIASAGLFFSDLLTFLRSDMPLFNSSLNPSAIARSFVGLATWRYCLISAQGQRKFPIPKHGEHPVLIWSSLEALQISTATGQLFDPDELITGLGDALKYILDEWQSNREHQGLRTEYDATPEDINDISFAFNQEISYSCAVEYWLDCVGHNYGLTHHRDGVAHVPFNRDQEIARIVSIYRRLHLNLQDKDYIYQQWFHQLSTSEKKRFCEIPLISQICLANDRIQSIELSQNGKVLNMAAFAVAEKIILHRSYYQNLLDEPLPRLHDFTLNEMIDGWRLLQSLAAAVFDEISSFVSDNTKELPRFASAKEMPRFAPKIASRVLSAVFSKALHMEKHRAQQLVELFVFRDVFSQEVWTQPLIRCEEDYWLVIPCIHSVHLERIVERWIRQGGLELERRGTEFERFCRESLHIPVAKSPIKDAITIVQQGVTFSPPGGNGEQIDLVIVIADTVLLIEAKCYLWPDDSLEFTRYRAKIDGAVKQIKRKHDAVVRHYTAFSNRLAQLGYALPASPKIVCCVLTNSAVFAGFPIEGVPIADLDILGQFFDNELIKIEERRGGKVFERHAIQFYKDKTEAGHVLEKYLLDPPQLRDMKESVKGREVVFPVEHEDYGKFIHTTFRVEIDAEKMMARYRSST